jgi:hypothetical protein
MKNNGALYYPYTRFRNETWLKSTLLVFPKIYRMIPLDFDPGDSSEIRKLYESQLVDHANLFSPGVVNSLNTLLANIKTDLARDAGFRNRFSKEAADRRKHSDGDPFGYQIHSKKAADLLRELKRDGLAWDPDMPDGDHYIEMHPDIGEAIMSSIAVACALDEGIDIVADDAPVHDCVLRNAEDEIYRELIARPKSIVPQTFSADRSKIELLVFQQFDLSKLSAENIVRLREERAPLDRFRAQMVELAESIKSMRDQERFEKRLKEKVDQTLSEWQTSKSKPSTILKEIFTGGEKPAGDFLKKIAEQAAGPGVTGAIVGGLGTGALLGAAAGLGVALVIHAASTVRAVRDREKNSPYRFLTLLQNSGVAFSAGH